jgi:signal peptidase II
MSDISSYVPIVSDLLGLKLSYNTGIAFSLPIEGIFLKIITLVILFWLVYYYMKEEYPKRSSLLDMGYVLIFSWAIAHTYERLWVGHVIDFISVKYFAILNFADIFISAWTFLVILSYVIIHWKHR